MVMRLEKKWWVSPFNLIDEVRRGMNLPKKVGFYDVTLRDGEQTPGVVFKKEEKVKIAKALDELGVQRIEAGMPVVSAEDKAAVKAIANLGLSAEVWGFCRCVKTDVDACLEANVDAVVCEIATSELKFKAYGMDREKAMTRAVETLKYAKDHGLHTAFFSVDMTRANLDFLKTINTAAVKEGKADELIVVDTLGVALPEVMYHLTKKFKEWFKVPIHIHCHNDFGLSTACELAAIKAGAEWAHVTINGLGEKAGNTDLSELALSLYLLYGIDVGLKYDKLVSTSKLVEQLSGVKMPPFKPVVGENIFKRESGVTVMQLISYPPAVESFVPELVGGKREIVLGKKSGRHSIEWKLKNLGITVPEEQIEPILGKVKALGESKKSLVSDEEFKTIVNQTRGK
jgi:isopropylmalate/homocitrate/citramalate synthase